MEKPYSIQGIIDKIFELGLAHYAQDLEEKEGELWKKIEDKKFIYLNDINPDISNMIIKKEIIEDLVAKVLKDGEGETDCCNETVLDHDTDGSCDIYYMKYQIFLIQQKKLHIHLTIKDGIPVLSTQYSEKTEWTK